MLGNFFTRLTREEQHSPIDAQKHFEAGVRLATDGLHQKALWNSK